MDDAAPPAPPLRGDLASAIGIRLLHLPDCPLANAVRETLRECLEQVGSQARVEEVEGAHPSPTLLIDGVDVTGREAPPGAYCRLDLPTRAQVLQALARAAERRRPAKADAHAPQASSPAPDTHGNVDGLMTVGRLARLTGIPVKTLRQYEDMGLIYTVGRSPGNYRLFGAEALWCVTVVGHLRALGLTLAEIVALSGAYLGGENAGPRLARTLAAVRARTESQIAELHERLEHIARFEAEYAAELEGSRDFRLQDPRAGLRFDPPPRGRVYPGPGG